MGRSSCRFWQEVTNTMDDEGKNYHIHRVFPCSRVADGMRRQKSFSCAFRDCRVKWNFSRSKPGLSSEETSTFLGGNFDFATPKLLIEANLSPNCSEPQCLSAFWRMRGCSNLSLTPQKPLINLSIHDLRKTAILFPS